MTSKSLRWLGAVGLALATQACVVRDQGPNPGFYPGIVTHSVSVATPQPYSVSSLPPDPLDERMTPSPGYGHVWIDGSWHWNGYEWVWVSGRWEQEQVGHVYVQPGYDYGSGGYVYTPGHWSTRDRLPRGSIVHDHRDGRPSVVAPPQGGGRRPGGHMDPRPTTPGLGPRPTRPVPQPNGTFTRPPPGPVYSPPQQVSPPVHPIGPRPTNPTYQPQPPIGPRPNPSYQPQPQPVGPRPTYQPRPPQGPGPAPHAPPTQGTYIPNPRTTGPRPTQPPITQQPTRTAPPPAQPAKDAPNTGKTTPARRR
jgi:hypothetical protein